MHLAEESPGTFDMLIQYIVTGQVVNTAEYSRTHAQVLLSWLELFVLADMIDFLGSLEPIVKHLRNGLEDVLYKDEPGIEHIRLAFKLRPGHPAREAMAEFGGNRILLSSVRLPKSFKEAVDTVEGFSAEVLKIVRKRQTQRKYWTL